MIIIIIIIIIIVVFINICFLLAKIHLLQYMVHFVFH